MLNWFLSILYKNEIITLDEAKYLSKELSTKLHPQDFEEAHAVVEKLLKDFKKNG